MKAYSLDFRCVVINAYESGEGTGEDVAEQFRVGTAFVKKMLRLHRAGESLEPQHGGGASQAHCRRASRVAGGGRDASRCHTRRAQGAAAQRRQGGGERTDRGSGAAETGVAAQQKSFVASERNAQQRQTFRREGAELNVGDFVFVDEMGINLDLAREYGRAAPGERVVDSKPSTHGDNLSVIGALGYDELRAARSVSGAVDGDAGLVFTKDVLAPRLHPGDIVFLDNGPTHKMAAIEEAITAVEAKVKFLPPYSPDFSPIENCWSKVKTFLRRVAARTRQDLDTALSQALAMITHDDIIRVLPNE
jgi:transposase